MVRLTVFGLAGVISLAMAVPVAAQGFNPFGDTTVNIPRNYGPQARSTRAAQTAPRTAATAPVAFPFQWDGADATASARQRSLSQAPGPLNSDGGPRPSISGATPPLVPFRSSYGAGNIVIDSGGRALYYVVSSTQAYRYPVAVGREGFAWTGVEKVSRKAEWPEWRPPVEMRERQPGLPEVMTGGLRNPLGARAIYLGSSLYRIHGTNDSRSIGSASSSGCFRMANVHVVDLYNRVSSGATVHVVGRLPGSIARSVADNDTDDAPAAAPKKRKRASM